MKTYRIAFSGSRSVGREVLRDLENAIQNVFNEVSGMGLWVTGVSGGAQGFDALAVEACRRHNIPCDILFPSPEYVEHYWISGKGGPANSDGYAQMIDDCAVSGGRVLHPVEPMASWGVNLRRNMALVNMADTVIIGAYDFNNLTGGTGHTYKYAKRIQKNRPLLFVKHL